MAINDYNLKLTEQQYRDLEIPSYSMLSSIDKQGLDVVGGIKQSFNLKFGSLVDMMCFEPHLVDKTFYSGVSNKPPTTNVKNICDLILQDLKGVEGDSSEFVTPLGRRKQMKITGNLEAYKDTFSKHAAKLKIYSNYTEDKLKETVLNGGTGTTGKEYFKDKIASRGKILIKPEMWAACSHTAATLITHPYTAKYFTQGVKGIEIIYQYKFDVKVKGRRCKGMLDCLVVNHNLKLIIPVDLKTGEAPCKDFPMLYTMHKYHIQGALYREALMSIVDNDFDLSGYKVQPFEFVYISKLNPNKPMRFRVSEDMHEAAMNGFTDRYSYSHKGVLDLLDDYYYSVQNNNAEYSQEEVNNKGLVEMSVKTIIGT